MLDSPKKTAKWMQSIFFPICHFRGWQFWRLANLPPNLFLIPGSCGFSLFPFLPFGNWHLKASCASKFYGGVPLRYGVKRRVLGMRGPGRRESLFFLLSFPKCVRARDEFCVFRSRSRPFSGSCGHSGFFSAILPLLLLWHSRKMYPLFPYMTETKRTEYFSEYFWQFGVGRD